MVRGGFDGLIGDQASAGALGRVVLDCGDQ
jgi:hypothetical protein